MIVFWPFSGASQVFLVKTRQSGFQQYTSLLCTIGNAINLRFFWKKLLKRNKQWLWDQNRNWRCQLFWNNLLSKPAHTIAHKQQLKVKCFSMIWRGKSGRKVSFYNYLVFRQNAVGIGDVNGKGSAPEPRMPCILNIPMLSNQWYQQLSETKIGSSYKLISKPLQYLLKFAGEDSTSNLQ